MSLKFLNIFTCGSIWEPKAAVAMKQPPPPPPSEELDETSLQELMEYISPSLSDEVFITIATTFEYVEDVPKFVIFSVADGLSSVTFSSSQPPSTFFKTSLTARLPESISVKVNDRVDVVLSALKL